MALVLKLLDNHGAALTVSSLLEDVSAGIGHCLCSAQVRASPFLMLPYRKGPTL